MRRFMKKLKDAHRGVNILKLLKTLEPGVKTVTQQKRVISNQSLTIRKLHKENTTLNERIKKLNHKIITKDNVPDALMHDIDNAIIKSDRVNDSFERFHNLLWAQKELKKLGCTF